MIDGWFYRTATDFRSVVIPGCTSGAGQESILPIVAMDSGLIATRCRNDDGLEFTLLPSHRGGAGCAISLRCASAATVDVPIGPAWSYKKHSPIATPSVA